ncbi:MAG: hypothetical protein AAF570_04820 [Bacteroidota bacterium]
MHPKGITAVHFLNDLGSTPAMVNMRTGALLLNKRMWDKMPPEQRFFVVLHELGHLRNQSRDEFDADAWAFNEYARRGYPLSASIYALSRNLSFNRPDHLKRVNAQWQRAALFDYQENGNAAALDGMGYAGFICLTDKCRKRRNEAKAKRQEEKTRRTEIRQGGKSDRTETRGETRQTAYQHGIDPNAWISNSVGHAAGAAASIWGSGGSGGGLPTGFPMTPEQRERMEAQQSRTNTWIILGVVAAVFVVGIYLYTKGRGK